jgi:hypothetical protein
MKKPPYVTKVIGAISNRLQLAGEWIDQLFVSWLNPRPSGSKAMAALEPAFRMMDPHNCDGGYHLVASKLPVPGTFQVTVRIVP